MSESSDATVTRFFRAMQTGATAADEMFSLFAEDAVYIEPFTGAPLRHEGLDAIRASMKSGWENPLPELTLTVDRVDVEGAHVTAHWTCRSPALPGGLAHGVNHFEIHEGKITRLETTMEASR